MDWPEVILVHRTCVWIVLASQDGLSGAKLICVKAEDHDARAVDARPAMPRVGFESGPPVSRATVQSFRERNKSSTVDKPITPTADHVGSISTPP
jgi:hypothetical protein